MKSNKQSTEQTQWFRPRSAGVLWGVPSNAKGWYSYGVFVAVWLLALAWLISTGSSTDQIRVSNIAIFAVIFLADCIALFALLLRHGVIDKNIRKDTKRATKADKPRSH